MNYTNIFSPLTIGNVTLKNRIVMPPLVIWKADESAEVTEAHLNHYRISSGPGLMIVEATVVSPEGRLRETQLGIFEDRQLEGMKKLTDTIHQSGAAAGTAFVNIEVTPLSRFSLI